eukprot:gene5064-6303_t
MICNISFETCNSIENKTKHEEERLEIEDKEEILENGLKEEEEEEEEEAEINEELEENNNQEENDDQEEIGMFGVSLLKLMELQGGGGEEQEEDGDDVPIILNVLIDKIKDSNGLKSEGLFRINGNLQLVETLSTEGFDPESEDLEVDVNTWCSLLKKWVRELPEPLIPDHLYDSFVNCKTIESMESIIAQIEPIVFYKVLDRLGLFFGEMLQQENIDSTKMDIDNLAIILTPTLFNAKYQDVSAQNLSNIVNQQKQQLQSVKFYLKYYQLKFKENNNQQQDQE